VGVTTLSRSIWPLGAAQHERVQKRVEAVSKALGTRIRELRHKRGWSQEYLAELAGIHRTYMWGIERGVRNPSLRHLAHIADALGVSIAALFTATD
jgi:DNA-binding XRE family transcriptional regulator